MPYDKPEFHRSGHGSVQRSRHSSSQYSDVYDGEYEFDYDYDADVLTDRGYRSGDPAGFGGHHDTAEPVDRDYPYEHDDRLREYADFRRAADDQDYRPEQDYDPDYQDSDHSPDPPSDHAQQFHRIDASMPAPRGESTRHHSSRSQQHSRSQRTNGQQSRTQQARSQPSRSQRSRSQQQGLPPVRKPRGWVRWLAVGGLAVVALAGIGAAIAYRYADNLIAGRQTSVESTAVAEIGEPINILVVGSDSREGLSGEQLDQTTEDVGGKRTDTIMVLHVHPEQKKAVLVSIPRDLRTEVNGETAKINASGSGGPSLMVKTVEETTGLDINHYVEVNFAGFLEVVDTVGGVELCNNTGEPMIDKMAGLNLPPGCHNVKGDQALAFVRARYIDSDFGRIERQQQFMRALLSKIGSTGNLINIPQLVTLANDLSGTITTDEAFSASEAIKIARGVGSLSLDDVDMRTYPSEGRGPECAGCAAFVHALPEAEILMQAIASEAEELPPVGLTGEDNVTLGGVTLRVVNGGEIDGAASDAAEALEALGMTTSVEGNTEAPIGPTTQISYGENMAEEARLLRWLLNPTGIQLEMVPADPENGPGPNSLTLIIGGNWRGVEGQLPAPTGSGTADPEIPGSDATDPSATDPGTAEPEPGADLSGVGED